MNKTYLGAHLSPTKRRRGGLMEKKLEDNGTSLSQEAAYERRMGRRGAVRGGGCCKGRPKGRGRLLPDNAGIVLP